MPEMDGLTFLSHLMHRRPTPVVMVSSLTEAGALATFEALQLGAVDFVHKPDGTVSLDLHRVEDEICAKVAAAVRARLHEATLEADGVRTVSLRVAWSDVARSGDGRRTWAVVRLRAVTEEI